MKRKRLKTKSKIKPKIKKRITKKLTKRKIVKRRKQRNPGEDNFDSQKFESDVQSSFSLPENKEKSFKLGFLFGLSDGYKHFNDGLQIRNLVRKINEIITTNNLDFEQISGQRFFEQIEYFSNIDLFETGRLFGIKKAVEKASFSDTPLEFVTQIAAVDRLISGYQMTDRLPDFRTLEML